MFSARARARARASTMFSARAAHWARLQFGTPGNHVSAVDDAGDEAATQDGQVLGMVAYGIGWGPRPCHCQKASLWVYVAHG